MNNVTVVGNVGKDDPELKFSKAGKAICSFSVVESKKNGEEYVSHWYDVTCFGQLAENVSESLSSGSRVIVSGQLEQQKWEKDGEKRSKVQIVAWQVGPSLEYATCTVTKNERTEER